MVTRKPRIFNNLPSDEAVKPFPRELATPPVTNTCFGIFALRPLSRFCRRTVYLTTGDKHNLPVATAEDALA